MSSLIFVAILIWCTVLMTSCRKRAKEDPSSTGRSLSRSEKIQIWVICLLNPVIGGVIMYYGWRRPLPVMANQANRISFIAFFIEVAVIIVGLVLTELFGSGLQY